MDWMRSEEIPFTAKEIIYDSAADAFVDSENTREMYERCGGPVEFVPQIFFGDDYIGGWKKLEPLIASGEVKNRLSAIGLG